MTALLRRLPFEDYLEPVDLDEALKLLAEDPGETLPIAGGTDLMIRLKRGLVSPRRLLGLRRLEALAEVSAGEDELTFGAAFRLSSAVDRFAELPHLRALSRASSVMGSPQVRNLATVGGNLCNAAPSADTAPALLVADCAAVLASSSGERSVPLDEFFQGPGQTSLQPGELLVSLSIPAPPADQQTVTDYERLTIRAGLDIALVGVGVGVTIDSAGSVSRARIAIGAVAPTPLRVGPAEEVLRGQPLTAATIGRAAELAVKAARPIDDVRTSARYRKQMVGVLVGRLLERCRREVVR